MVETEYGFVTPLRVESIDASNWRILEDLIWVGSKGDEFVVFAGEETDFATVPWWTQSLIPRTGTWTKAAVLHDQMCNDLNRYYRLKKRYDELYDDLVAQHKSTESLVIPLKPTFSSNDTDNIFRKNARDEGTDVIRAELLWVGVRYGSLANAARRGGSLKTAPRLFADTIAILICIGLIVAGLSWAWPW